MRWGSPLDQAPDLHREDCEETPALGPSGLGQSSPVTLGDFIAVVKKSQAKTC